MNWRTVASVALGVLGGLITTLGVIAVSVAGFSLSYDAIKAVGEASHISQDISWLLPVSVDGAMAVATIATLVMQRASRSTMYPWIVVVTGALISIGCNGAHATGEPGHLDLSPTTRFAVSAIPAVMLALSIHLLVLLLDTAADRLSVLSHDEAPAETRQIVEEVPVPVPTPLPVPMPEETTAVDPPVAEPDIPAVATVGRTPTRRARPARAQTGDAVLLELVSGVLETNPRAGRPAVLEAIRGAGHSCSTDRAADLLAQARGDHPRLSVVGDVASR